MTVSISVIMPVYNAAGTVRDSLLSVLAQTGVDVDVICVDDGSSDESHSIMSEIGSLDTRVHILSQENRGAGPARNRGISLATGNYIAFMDPDDRYPCSTTLSSLASLAMQTQLPIVGGNVAFFSQAGAALAHDSRIEFVRHGLISFQEFQQVTFFQRFLYKRSFLTENHISFPSYRRYQDPPFLAHALQLAGQIATTTEITYCYTHQRNRVLWTPEKCVDYYTGVHDLIALSQSSGLERLFQQATTDLSNPEVLGATFKHRDPRALRALKSAIEAATDTSGTRPPDKRFRRFSRRVDFFQRLTDHWSKALGIAVFIFSIGHYCKDTIALTLWEYFPKTAQHLKRRFW